MEARFSAPVQTGPRAHPAPYTMGTGSFLVVKRPGSGVDQPPHLAPRLKKDTAIPLLPFWAFVACSSVNFTFTFYFLLSSFFSFFLFIPSPLLYLCFFISSLSFLFYTLLHFLRPSTNHGFKYRSRHHHHHHHPTRYHQPPPHLGTSPPPRIISYPSCIQSAVRKTPTPHSLCLRHDNTTAKAISVTRRHVIALLNICNSR